MQQKALQPIATHWNTLPEEQKRKWLALSRNFGKMSATEQATLHSRMSEWAALSPEQRTRARLNFAEIKHLTSANERKAKWEAYKALSETEKRKLAERAGSRPPSVATSVRPVPSQKLASIPHNTTHPRRIELAPRAVTPNAENGMSASPGTMPPSAEKSPAP